MGAVAVVVVVVVVVVEVVGVAVAGARHDHLDFVVVRLSVGLNDQGVDNQTLIQVNEEIRNHPVEDIGRVLRGYMTAMKRAI